MSEAASMSCSEMLVNTPVVRAVWRNSCRAVRSEIKPLSRASITVSVLDLAIWALSRSLSSHSGLKPILKSLGMVRPSDCAIIL